MKISVSRGALHVHALNHPLEQHKHHHHPPSFPLTTTTTTTTTAAPPLNCDNFEIALMNKITQDDHEESSNKENQHAVDVAVSSAAADGGGGGRLSDVEIMSLSFNALEHLQFLSLSSLSTKNIFFKMRGMFLFSYTVAQ